MWDGLAGLTCRHPARVATIAALLTIVAFAGASRLRIRSSFAELLAADHPSVVALEEFRSQVGGESTAMVFIRSPSREGNRAMAERLIPRIEALRDSGGRNLVAGIDYREPDWAFLRTHALYLATEQELDALIDHLEHQIEKASREANPFLLDLTDDTDIAATSTADAVGDLTRLYDQYIVGEYPESLDGTVLALRLYVNGSQSDLRFVSVVHAALSEVLATASRAAHHPEMTLDLGGRFFRQSIEIARVRADVVSSFGAGIGGVLGLVATFFAWRLWKLQPGRGLLRALLVGAVTSIAVVGAPLVVALLTAGALGYLLVGHLNLLTSTLGLLLAGLGIDYSVHLYARFLDERSGHSVDKAVRTALARTGPAIAVSGATTALALLVLAPSEFRGFSEFGLLAGLGILGAVATSLTLAPAMIVLLGPWLGATASTAPDAAIARPEGSGQRSGHRRRSWALVAFAMLCVVAGWRATMMPFEYDFSALQPDYPELRRLSRLEGQVYPSRGRNPAYVMVGTDAEAGRVVAAIESSPRSERTVRRVETLQERLPVGAADQARRLAVLAEVRRLLDDPILSPDDEDLTTLRDAAQARSPMPVDRIPASLRRRFSTKDGTLGHFVVIYPAEGLSDGQAAMRFAETASTIRGENEVWHGASSSLVAAAMLRTILDEQNRTIVTAGLAIALSMLVMFRSWRWAALALAPLAAGAVLMLGLAEALGMKLNLYNLVVLPAVLGIGNDVAVHVVARYRQEGVGSLRRVVRSVAGPAIVGSLTTMIGFAGLMLSFQPGLRSIGQLAVVGIATTLLATLVGLPLFLHWRESHHAVSNADDHG
jgi:hypothetical protein